LPSIGPLLRLRSDEQLVRLFRTGNQDAFRVIHDRYRARLLAYARQMLAGSRQDAEDALQDVFVRAYHALRTNDRDVTLRAWLYRVAHNRCIDELRRPAPPPPETLELIRAPEHDPIAVTERRESLKRLVADVQRLPDQQRSALLMREIGGMAYEDVAGALDVTVPAVKSLLVRARVGLATAAQARDTACAEIREELADAHERGVRASGLARRHLQDCGDCRVYRQDLRSGSKALTALVPVAGPAALLAKLAPASLFGKLLGGGATAGGSAAAAGGGAGTATATAAGAAVGGGVAVSASHVVAVVAAVVVGAGGAVEVQRTLAPPPAHHAHAAVRTLHAGAAAGPAALPVPALAPDLQTTTDPSVDPSADPALDPTDPQALSAAAVQDGIGLSPDASPLDPTTTTTADGGAAPPPGMTEDPPPATTPANAPADPSGTSAPTPAPSTGGDSTAPAPSTPAPTSAPSGSASGGTGTTSAPATSASTAATGGAGAPVSSG
jgi:RNA polymerase sigma factor (sigma-70 family)